MNSINPTVTSQDLSWRVFRCRTEVPQQVKRCLQSLSSLLFPKPFALGQEET